MLQNPQFWVSVSFILFMVLAIRPAYRAIVKGLDARSAKIDNDLKEAARLRAEAEAVLASYQQRQRDSLKEAEQIIADARADAQRMSQDAETTLKAAIDARLKSASEKIAQAEGKALQEVRAHIVDIAMTAARSLITDQLDKSSSDILVKDAISDLSRKIH